MQNLLTVRGSIAGHLRVEDGKLVIVARSVAKTFSDEHMFQSLIGSQTYNSWHAQK